MFTVVPDPCLSSIWMWFPWYIQKLCGLLSLVWRLRPLQVVWEHHSLLEARPGTSYFWKCKQEIQFTILRGSQKKMGHTWHWQLLQVGLVEKKPLSTEPDQKMAENKVTVIHKIGFKVWNRFLRHISHSTFALRIVKSGLCVSQWTRTRRLWLLVIKHVFPQPKSFTNW